MPDTDQRVPELVGGVDIRTLPLSALDGYVLSRIDGRTRCNEIMAMTGLPPEQVAEILDRLVALGAVRFQEPAAPARPVAPRASAGTPANTSHSGIRGAGQSAPVVPKSGLFNAQSIPPTSARAPSSSGMPAVDRPPSATFPPVSEPPPSPSVRPRTLSQPPVASSTPPRRRPSVGAGRRVFAESSISGPPPDMRSVPPRARNSTPARPRTPVPSRPPPSGSDAPRHSIPVTLPPLSMPPSMSAPPVFTSQQPTGTRPVRDSVEMEERATPVVQKPALYDEKELDEEVDLTRERRKQILDLFYRLSDINYYALLGVKQGAEKKEIRTAYFQMSKAFHPDSMFRKELGSYKAKMTAVFQAATEAYETLGKKKTRDEYDAYLRSTRSVQEAERTLAADDVVQAEVNVEVPRPPPVPSTDYDLPPPTPLPGPPREVSADAQRIARELIAKRLRGLPQRPAAPANPSPTPVASVKPGVLPPRPSTPEERQEFARQLGRTLMDVSKVTGSNDKVARATTAAKSAFEAGDIAASVQHMARAFSLAPERVDLHQEYERLTRMLAQQMSHDYEEQAKFEMKQSKFAAAATTWAKVCEGRPEDAEAHRNTAFCMLKAGGDQRGAQKYAQQAVYLAPNDIDARILLAQTYLTVGLKLNAKRELDAAAKLDPENEVVKNLLSDLNK